MLIFKVAFYHIEFVWKMIQSFSALFLNVAVYIVFLGRWARETIWREENSLLRKLAHRKDGLLGQSNYHSSSYSTVTCDQWWHRNVWDGSHWSIYSSSRNQEGSLLTQEISKRFYQVYDERKTKVKDGPNHLNHHLQGKGSLSSNLVQLRSN